MSLGACIAATSTGLLMPIAAVAQSEVLRTHLYGNQIILFDDGTWRFADPAASLADRDLGEGCIEAAELALSICDLNTDWALTYAITESDYVEYVLVSRHDANISLSVSTDNWGHGNDPEYLEWTEAPGSGLVNWLLGAVLGMSQEEFQTVRLSDTILLSETLFIDPYFASYTIDLTGPSQSLYLGLDLAVPYDQTATLAEIEATILPTVGPVLSQITLDGVALPALLAAADERSLIDQRQD